MENRRGVFVSIPCWLLCLPGPIEALLATRRYWFTEEALNVHLALITWILRGSLLLAGLLAASPAARAWTAAHLEELGRQSPRRHAAWVGAAAAGIFTWFLVLKYCQYRGFQLPVDSAIANVCYNIAHHLSFAGPVFGFGSYFAVHFIPLLALLAPPFWFTDSIWPLIVLQTLLVASAPVAAYLLVWRKTGSSLTALCALWLVCTSPFLFHIAAASLYPGMYLSLFFLWAMTAAELGAWTWAAAAFLLMALSIEQSCLVFFGLGLYLVPRLGWRQRRSWLVGGGVCLAAAVLFLLEMKLKASFPEASQHRTWGMFRHLGATPLDAARAALWPPSKLKPLARMLLSTAFLPLLDPLSLIPWAFNCLPSVLAQEGDVYHTIRLQYAGYFIGPLWWAALRGLIGAHKTLDKRRETPWLVVVVLLFGLVNLRQGPNVLLRDWQRPYFSEGPVIAALVPPGASLWAPEYLAPRLSGRSQLKALPVELDGVFLGQLFRPDFVVVDRDWLGFAAPAARDRLLTFFAREGYLKAAERSKLVLLKHPRPGPPGVESPPLTLPEADASAERYGSALLRNDDAAGTVALWRAMAERGDEQAQYDLGSAYYAGVGVAKDEGEARRWWLEAAGRGVPEAANSLGLAAASAQDWPAAVHWFRTAAEAGHAGAQYNLGIAYATGRGLPQDYAAAAAWFRRGAEGGNADAQYNLGVCLADGLGVPADRAGAVHWLAQAAAKGHPQARKKLAKLSG